MKKMLTTGLVAAGLFPFAALADSPGWTFIEASYISGELESQSDAVSDFEPEGGEVAASLRLGEGSMTIMENIFFDVRYSKDEDDINVIGLDIGLDFDRWGVGMGGIWEATESTHLYSRLGYENWQINIDIADEIKDMLPEEDREELEDQLNQKESGATIAVGVRSMVFNSFELRGEVAYSDVLDSEVSYTAGAFYTFAKHFTVGTSYNVLGDLKSWRGTVRYQF